LLKRKSKKRLLKKQQQSKNQKLLKKLQKSLQQKAKHLAGRQAVHLPDLHPAHPAALHQDPQVVHQRGHLPDLQAALQKAHRLVPHPALHPGLHQALHPALQKSCLNNNQRKKNQQRQ
tara:strand:- start:140 stop:493 length:354 start_codon:yes stop_codon:yes gene_type:complete